MKDLTWIIGVGLAGLLIFSGLIGCASTSERSNDIQIMHYNNFLLDLNDTYSVNIDGRDVHTELRSDKCDFFTRCPDWFQYYLGEDTRVLVFKDNIRIYKKNESGNWEEIINTEIAKEMKEITDQLLEDIKKQHIRYLRERKYSGKKPTY